MVEIDEVRSGPSRAPLPPFQPCYPQFDVEKDAVAEYTSIIRDSTYDYHTTWICYAICGVPEDTSCCLILAWDNVPGP